MKKNIGIFLIITAILLCISSYIYWYVVPNSTIKTYIQNTTREWYEIKIQKYEWLCISPCKINHELFNKDYLISYEMKWDKIISYKIHDITFNERIELINNLNINSLKSVEILRWDINAMFDWPRTVISVTKNWSVVFETDYNANISKKYMSWSADDVNYVFNFYKKLEEIRNNNLKN